MKKLITLLSLLALLTGLFPFQLNTAQADWTYRFRQSDWSGGQSGSYPAHPANQTTWTYWGTKDANLSAGTDLRLSSTSGNWQETSDADFNAGDKTDYIYVGSNTVYPQKPNAYACEDNNDNICQSARCDTTCQAKLAEGQACDENSDCTSGSCQGSVCMPPPCSASTACGDSCSYQGIIYTTVQIGTQCWFSKSLNYGTRVNGSAEQNNDSVVEKYCYSDSEANCTTDGALYQWPEAMALPYSCYNTDCSGQIQTPHQGLCPTGWHIPTDTEWTTLTDYLSANSQYWCGGVSTQIAKSLASTDASVPNWTNHATACNVGNDRATNNTTGFTTLPAGYRATTGSFATRANFGYLWSASQASATGAWVRSLLYNSATVNRLNVSKAVGFSARCLKN